MEPIISPEWFYLAHVFNTIYDLSLLILFISIFVMVVSLVDCVCENYKDEKKMMYKIIKICAIVAVICIILLIFIPDKKAVYAMIAASVITPDNISSTEDHIVDLVSRIAEAVRETK